MLTDSLDEREIAVLILALRFWRARRGDSVTRRSDPFVTPDTIDLLLAKLGSRSLSSVPPADRSNDLLSR
jgi:hypothetical protein